MTILKEVSKKLKEVGMIALLEWKNKRHLKFYKKYPIHSIFPHLLIFMKLKMQKKLQNLLMFFKYLHF